MAEFWFEATVGELALLVEPILASMGVLFVVDRAYDEPVPVEHAEASERLIETLRTWRRVFVFAEAYSEFPPFMRRQESGEMAGKYFVDLSRGGPCLDLTLPGHFDEGGVTWFVPGMLSFQKLYWNDELTQAFPAPGPLKDAYGIMKRMLQRQLTDRKIGTGRVWATAGAWRKFEKGCGRFVVEGKWCGVGGEVGPPAAWRR